MNNSFFHLASIQFKEFFREPAVLFWGFLFPILVAGVLGLAFMNQPENDKTIAVVNSVTLEGVLKQKFDSLDKATELRFIYLDKGEAELRQKRGSLPAMIEVERGGEIVFHYDPENSEARLTYLMGSNAILSIGSEERIREEYITAKGNRYIDFLVPGLIAMGIMNSCLWGIGWNLIDYRIKKLMRRMIATPMRRSVFLASQALSRGVLLFVETGSIFVFASLVFDVEVQGSWLGLLVVFGAGFIAFAGLAVLTASRARHSQVGNGLINAASMPMTILSGVFFSYENFPEWAADIIRFFPLTLLADGLRAVFNEGASVQHIWVEASALIGMGIAFFIGGLKIFKWG